MSSPITKRKSTNANEKTLSVLEETLTRSEDTSSNDLSGGSSDESGPVSTRKSVDSAASTVPHALACHKDDGVKIICVGLMRTGLKALRGALTDLGYTHFYDQEDIPATYQHWDKVINNTADADPFPAIFQGAQVVMGMPVFCFWEQILERYPGARVILTVRNEDEWWESVCRAKDLMDKSLPGAPLRYGETMRRVESLLMPSYHKFCEVLRFSWSTTLGAYALNKNVMNESATRGNFRQHNTYVQTKLSKKRLANGNRQLLVYNPHDGWDPICSFLNKDAPTSGFPSLKSVPYFLSQDDATEMKPALDDGQEIEELLTPESEFGVRMRQELLSGLCASFVGITLVVASAVFAHFALDVQMPVSFLGLVYLAAALACWTAYVVVHGLVMRVPALLVLPLAIKSLLIAASLQACYLTYGILKEQIVTQDKIASPVLILSSRVMSVLCGMAALLFTNGCASFKGASLYSFSAFGLTNEISTWAGYEMLKYVSFPVQVMAKSCKLLPNMIMGRVLNGTRYAWSEYVQAVGAMVCVTVMHLSDEGGHKKGKSSGSADDEQSELVRVALGMGLLVLFFACDSFTSQWQTKIYKQNPKITQTQMMVAGNAVGVCITMCSIALRWKPVKQSLLLAVAKPDVMGRILCLGLSGALGQFCIYTAIKALGPLSFTWIMTSRQLLSVLISLVMFGHGVSLTKLGCIMTVFAIMSSKQLSRTLPAVFKTCRDFRSRLGGAAAKPHAACTKSVKTE